MHASAADRSGQVVDFADMKAVPVRLALAECPRLKPWVGAEEMPHDVFKLIVRKHLYEVVRAGWVDQMVVPALEDDHRPTCPRQFVSHR